MDLLSEGSHAEDANNVPLDSKVRDFEQLSLHPRKERRDDEVSDVERVRSIEAPTRMIKSHNPEEEF